MHWIWCWSQPSVRGVESHSSPPRDVRDLEEGSSGTRVPLHDPCELKCLRQEFVDTSHVYPHFTQVHEGPLVLLETFGDICTRWSAAHVQIFCYCCLLGHCFLPCPLRPWNQGLFLQCLLEASIFCLHELLRAHVRDQDWVVESQPTAAVCISICSWPHRVFAV